MTYTWSKHVAKVNLTAKINRMCLTDVILVSYLQTHRDGYRYIEVGFDVLKVVNIFWYMTPYRQSPVFQRKTARNSL